MALPAMTVRTTAAAVGLVLLTIVSIFPTSAEGQSPLHESSNQQRDAGQVVRRSPQLNVQFYRALAAWRSKVSLLEAKVRTDHILRAVPHDAETRKLRAKVLLDLNRPEAAGEDARRVVNEHPDDGEAHLLLTEALRRSGDREQARRALNAAAAHIERSAPLHVRLSWNAVQLGLADRAETYASRAIAYDANLPAAYYQLARVYVLTGERSRAAKVLAQGLDYQLLNPGAVARDTLLKQTMDHPLLERYFDR